MTQKIDAVYLRECFDYNAETGDMFWKERPAHHFLRSQAHLATNRRMAGQRVCIDFNGYVRVNLMGKKFLVHRLAWMIVYGRWPLKHIDHINGDKADNRICNLRECDDITNGQNQRKPHSNNKSGYLGVSYSKSNGKWRAAIRSEGKRIFIGHFPTPQDASVAYLEAKSRLHPFSTISMGGDKP